VRGMSTNIRKRDKLTLQIIDGLSVLQETEGQKTNNGIQYRLQLLYANGKSNIYTYLCGCVRARARTCVCMCVCRFGNVWVFS
jgi:hypothetical protein